MKTTSLLMAMLGGLGAGSFCPAQTSNRLADTSSVLLTLTSPSNGLSTVTLQPTTADRVYELLSRPDFASPWTSGGFLAGAPGQTSTNLAIGSGNLFFRARSFPTPGQLLLTLGNSTPITAYVNGQSNILSPFYGNSVLVGPPLYSLNVGYDGADNGPASVPLLPPQNVVAISGFGPALTGFTNLCASYTPITSLDLSGLPAIQDVECYTCSQLRSVQIAHLPTLTRACVEQCNLQGTLDFTGDINLADIRGAASHFTNIVFGGAGPKVWHLCLRDNPQLLTQVPLTNFPVAQILFLWNANQSGAFAPVSPFLQIAQFEQNAYTYADLSNQTNLFLVFAFQNSLTNLVIDGSPWIRDLEAENNQLGAAALDSILSNLDTAGLLNGYVNLSFNAGPPSVVGLTAATNLLGKGWTVKLDSVGFANTPAIRTAR